MDVLNIVLKGRLSHLNADNWFDDTVKMLQEAACNTLEIDCKELVYLSSIWLRQLLKIKKSGYNVYCTNVSNAVYDTLDMTGFTRLLHVEKAVREISIDKEQLVAKGSVGTVYKLDEDKIIKVFNSNVSFDMIRREREYAKSVFLSGLPTVISYEIVKVDNQYGIIYEMANADTFSAVLTKNMDRFDDLAGQYAELLKKINSTTFARGQFPEAKQIYRQYAEQSAFLSGAEKNILFKLIDSIPDRNSLLHGDFHANNIMLHENELTLIDLGDATLGHPIFDLASMYVSHILVGGYEPDFIRRGMGIDVAVCRELWNRTLHSYFAADSAEELDRKAGLIHRFAHLKLACMYTIVPGIENLLSFRPLEDARRVLFTDPDVLIDDLKEIQSW